MEDSKEVERRLPNLVVAGVGHSGTTILTRILGILGWTLPGVVDSFLEHREIRKLNQQIVTGANFDRERAVAVLHDLEQHQSWAVKDPRFALTLNRWRQLVSARSTTS